MDPSEASRFVDVFMSESLGCAVRPLLPSVRQFKLPWIFLLCLACGARLGVEVKICRVGPDPCEFGRLTLQPQSYVSGHALAMLVGLGLAIDSVWLLLAAVAGLLSFPGNSQHRRSRPLAVVAQPGHALWRSP